MSFLLRFYSYHKYKPLFTSILPRKAICIFHQTPAVFFSLARHFVPLLVSRPLSTRCRLFNFFVLIINIGNNWFLSLTRPFVAVFNLVCCNHANSKNSYYYRVTSVRRFLRKLMALAQDWTKVEIVS